MIDSSDNTAQIVQAATLTFAMLRFEQEAAHPRPGSARNENRIGIEEFVFLPSWKAIPATQVVSFLASLPCPALVFQTTSRGAVSLILLDELNGERKSWAQKTLDNQLAGIDDAASRFRPALDGNAAILLELRDESHVVTLDVLRIWSQRFSCPVGWNIGTPRPGAEKVSAQMHLYSMDGRVSPPSGAVAPWHRAAW